jgi:hypothetical protein
MKYIILKLTNGEFAKIKIDDIVYVCMANENEKGELFIERTIKISELDKIVNYDTRRKD